MPEELETQLRQLATRADAVFAQHELAPPGAAPSDGSAGPREVESRDARPQRGRMVLAAAVVAFVAVVGIGADLRARSPVGTTSEPASARTTSAGVVLTLKTDRTTMTPGELITAEVEIVNNTDQPVELAGGCNWYQMVFAEYVGAEGLAANLPAEERKALSGHGSTAMGESPLVLGGYFSPTKPCVAQGSFTMLSPHEHQAATFSWDGRFDGQEAPGGEMVVRAVMPFGENPPSAHVPLTMANNNAKVTPEQAIANAAHDPRVKNWIDQQPATTTWQPVGVQLVRGQWIIQVGSSPTETMRAWVDANSGAVTDFEGRTAATTGNPSTTSATSG